MVDFIQHIIAPHIQDLGGLQARRLLPSEVLLISEMNLFLNSP